ncbi:MAG: Coenzyme F420 hydrogenase/dehydrogenase, beta subunit C-terminal domain [Anaerostipes sp.]|uniref:Coenzyme F420 hydrogenase/dehydrogenase, beta subunit C-terminal domain n=1 Tax=Anaerostipes sp. TaxID=1872530 RepID=UPI003992A1F1
MNWLQPKVYAIKHVDESVIASSRSGGIFTAISDNIMENGGVVYGCILTKKFEAVHVRVEDKAGRDAMRGSKYIQSKIGDTFKNVKADLNTGRKVLFTGTSCQVEGLKKFLSADYIENLVCIDIVCHGVPSPLVWNKYLTWQEQKTGAKIIGVDFRNKRDYGWRNHIETLSLDNGKSISSKVFTKLFYDHAILRPCCYECPFKSVMHPGDITIADYWGIEKAAPKFDDNKGVSLVLVNNDKGLKVFESVRDDIHWKETRLEDSMQPPLIAPFPKPDNREQFWNDFISKKFQYIANKYADAGVVNLLKKVLRKIKRKLIR